jgi:hypothetical protein
MNSARREPPFENLPSRTSGSNDRVERSILLKKMEHSDTITLGTLGILGTSKFRAPWELLFSVHQDELLILR